MKQRRFGVMGVAAVVLGHVVHMAIMPVLLGSAAVYRHDVHTIVSWLLWIATVFMFVRFVMRVKRHVTVFRV